MPHSNAILTSIVYTGCMPTEPEDTIFNRIVRREVPAQIIYQDDDVTAFRDINPVAPVHVLVVPNRHLPTLNDAREDDERLLGKMMLTVQRLAAQLGVAENGYRVVVNCNRHGGQTVHYLHFHLLGGRKMTWPPG